MAAVFAGQAVLAQTTLPLGNAPAYPGTTAAVPASLRQGRNVVALQFDVAFNSGKVSALDAVRGERLTHHVIKSRPIAPGVERVLIYSRRNAAVAGTNLTLASLPFAVSASEHTGSGPLTPINLVLARAEATAIAPVSAIAGTIFVRPVNRLADGTVQFFLPSQPDTRYLIQATTDFIHWVTVTNATASGNFMNLLDTEAAQYPHRFYRWILYDAAAGEIGAVTQLPGGKLSFQVNGRAGRSYVLQASPDLQQWTDLSTNVATGGPLNFTNQISAVFPQRFFRLQSP